MRHDLIPSTLFQFRRHEFIRQMVKNSLAIFPSNDLMYRTGDQHFPFRQDSDLLALSGLHQPETLLLLYRGHTSKENEEMVFILPKDRDDEIWNGKRYSKSQAALISGITKVHSISQWKKITRALFEAAGTLYVNTEPDSINTETVRTAHDRMTIELKKNWPSKSFLSAQPILRKMMMVKHPLEIKRMKHAIKVSELAFERVLKAVKPGMKEFEVEAELTYAITAQGGQHAFDPIVASGKSACILHYTTNALVLQKGSLLLLDFGADIGGLSADVSRTIPVSGHYSKRQLQIYMAIWKVLQETTDLMRPGMTLSKLNAETGKMIDHALVDLKIISRRELQRQDKTKPLRRKYFMHGVSHHLGWDVHDKFEKDAPFKPGMVLTCEPGLYIKEEKTGIRLENDILITRGNPQNLCAGIPIDPHQIEELMSAGR